MGNAPNLKDKQILRELAKKVAEIASLPLHKEKIDLWKKLNGLKKTKPMIWITEIPWHEMDVNQELYLQTSDKFCRSYEKTLRQKIYQWEHMRDDTVVEPVLHCPFVINDTGFGISGNPDVVKIDGKNPVVSRHFNPLIKGEEDIEKIKMPKVTYDKETTEHNYRQLTDIFDGILQVKKTGLRSTWFAPWDMLVTWYGVQEALTDLIARPEFIHRVMERLIQAYICRLDQYEELNLLSPNNRDERVGSGGFGYTDELPLPDFNPGHVRAADLWGCATAQIFSEVSPQMHEEFALNYEILWLKRFGLNYYGCCEPLHRKINILKKVPNLRKISMSPWINLDEAIASMGDKYVFSYKPNPAVLAANSWNPQTVRTELENFLQKAKGCITEIIMKDISTVSYKPQRLWEWAKIAEEVTEEFA